MPFQGQPATASERKWNDSWWGYIKRCEPLSPEKKAAVLLQKQEAAKRAVKTQLSAAPEPVLGAESPASQEPALQFIIMKSSRAFDGATPEYAYRGSTCERAGIEPGKVYSDFNAASADADKLTEFNPVGFVVLTLLPEDCEPA